MGNTSTVRCPVSQSERLSVFFELPQVPVLINVLYGTAEDARGVTRGDIQLTFCEDSGHIFNQSFDLSLLDYSLEYDNSLHFSARFREYADALARELVEVYDLHGKTMVEVGCGKGDFLRLLCRLGNNEGVGYDPSLNLDADLQRAAAEDGVRYVRGYYNPDAAPKQTDFVCCQHTLEHIEDPRPFLEGIRDSVHGNRDTVFYFEVPNALWTLRDMAVWDVIYEHCGYYTPTSLRLLFESCGFEALDVRERFGGQYLSICARIAKNPATSDSAAARAELSDYVAAFKAAYAEKVGHFSSQLRQLESDGKSAAIWGAGSKGITFLNILGNSSALEFAVDLNPAKHGQFVAGTGHEIVPPEHLRQNPVDVILVMNPIYTDEIRSMVGELGLEPEFWAL
ncbi:MAG: class I SAM-dependent methyltransferase [Planctomycetota bacterium]